MRRVYRILLLTVLFFIETYHVDADMIMLRNKQPVTGKILNTTQNKVACILNINDVSITASINTADIAFVEYDNGSTIYFATTEQTDPAQNTSLRTASAAAAAPQLGYDRVSHWINTGLQCLLALVISFALFFLLEYAGGTIKKVHRRRLKKQSFSNRRTHTREALMVPFTYSTATQNNITTETVNISLGGLLFHSPEKHTPMCHISMRLLPLSSEEIIVEGMIIRCVYNYTAKIYSTGVSFAGLNEDTRNRLKRILNQEENILPEPHPSYSDVPR